MPRCNHKEFGLAQGAFAVALVGFGVLLGAPAQAQVSTVDGHLYALKAVLDPEAHTVVGEVVIGFTNHSARALDHVMFHLYLNAFESEDTVFMRESRGTLRGDDADGKGSITLSTLTLDGAPLLSRCDDEVIEGDRTQLRCTLAAPLPPGAAAEFRAEFISQLPPVFARSGFDDTFHMVAQWFPKLARLEPDGTFASFAYHGRGEFFADFADYTLEVTAPSTYIVGATGAPVGNPVQGPSNQTTHRFSAERVHDAAFVAWDRFQEISSEGSSPRIRVLFPHGAEGVARQHLEVTEDALSYFGQHFGAYPYPTLTVVLGPDSASGAAGMEYPTLFLASGSWYWIPGFHAGSEATTVHELAHQWFQGMIATNEVQYPMLDEGLTQWATGDFLRHRYGEGSGIDMPRAKLDMFELMRLWSTSGDTHLPPGRPAFEFRSSDYGASVYGRTSLVFETIARTWGRDQLHRALGAYAFEFRFGHPSPEDLFRVLDTHYWTGFSASVVRPALLDGITADVRWVEFRSEPNGNTYQNHIDAHRVTGLPLPLTLRLTTASGARTYHPWDADQERLRINIDTSERVVRAEIDPDRHNLLDRRRRDNQRGKRERSAWFVAALTSFQRLLSWMGP